MEDRDLKLEGLRFFHFLSPVRWQGNTYRSDVCSNHKVAEKVIELFPLCHHYIAVPKKHLIEKRENITFINYDYPRSVLLNRGIFDHRYFDFNFDDCDIDFIFNHQPECTFGIKSWLDSKRYNHRVGIASAYHWIDCDASRNPVSPPSLYRQFEAAMLSNYILFHSKTSYEYFLNCNQFNLKSNINESKIRYLPFSSKINNNKEEQFEIPNKKIVVFNHRWNTSTGVDNAEKFITKFLENNDDYIFWFTDDKSKIQQSKNIIVKKLSLGNYIFLLKNAYCTICFINDYCDWNLSIQDSVELGTPCLAFKHGIIAEMFGDGYEYFFSNYDEFEAKIKNINKLNFVNPICNLDSVFEVVIRSCVLEHILKFKDKIPKFFQEFINEIKLGNIYKRQILDKIRPNVKSSGGDSPLRVSMILNGIKDNYKSSITEYSI